MALNKRFIIFAVLAILALAACGDSMFQEGYPYTDITPQGYRVSIPESVYQNGLYLFIYEQKSFSRGEILTDEAEIRNKLLEWVDYWVEHWIESHPDINRDYLVDTARSIPIVIVDHFGMPCSFSVCKNGITYGYYHGDYIEVTVYLDAATDEPFNSIYSYPQHLVYTGDEVANWLQDDSWRNVPYVAGFNYAHYGGIGCVGIPHELDHAIGINHPL